jgi:hypothetical protein
VDFCPSRGPQAPSELRRGYARSEKRPAAEGAQGVEGDFGSQAITVSLNCVSYSSIAFP